ncbi:MAG: DUF1232 domain-containing protein [Deltaproteobacteria bacterium]|nr:MAG: DUF1232 domain-containing protein [Deltaproteobacteria bacterium]
MKRFERWMRHAQRLKQDVYAVYLAYKDPRVPWYAKFLAVCVVAYALSPIDLIPDPIPILGHLDDLILIPLGICLLTKMIPDEVMIEYREKARAMAIQNKPTNWIAAVVIITIWILVAVLIVRYLLRIFRC